MLKFRQLVAVVPVSGLRVIHGEAFAEPLHLLVREAGIFLEKALIRHGIFPEHVQSGMLPVFFYRENACHIGKRYVGLILQEIAQEIQVLLLHILILLPLPHHAVPFVN